MSFRRPLAAIGLLLASAGMAHADTVVLDNGDRLTGTIIQVTGGVMEFRPEATRAAVTIPWDRIATLSTDQNMQVLLQDGTEIIGRAEKADDGRIRLISADLDEPVSLRTTAVSQIRGPDTPARDRVRTTGGLNVGGTLTRGNTRTEAYNFNGAFEARTNVNRFRIDGQANQAKEDGELSRDNASGTARYDHFLSERIYTNTYVSLARDRFRDLRLRTSVGAGFGYQFFDTARRQLSAELGGGYVNEDYYDADNESNPAARWALDYEERLFDGGLRFFHRQEGLVSLENADDFVVGTQTGLRFPLMFGVTGTAQVNVDYDNTPPSGNSKTDQAYIVTMGYTW
ncbi:MAG: DUF481 domain-containing protein [Ectothiorhodospiraceae bacterium]|nr:DUF481 domain-containing protein [Ectothiorhodospiraceae bacterium]MCH8506367.1 DUF481 domain-containing protein [Ectothiorhodospiraceae bacterium]